MRTTLHILFVLGWCALVVLAIENHRLRAHTVHVYRIDPTTCTVEFQ